ncbi:MAG: DUF697 domain-containing protein [Myxococcales bacterium]|nr:DUF697 domain-containing protein [Myxococcales bacterium]
MGFRSTVDRILDQRFDDASPAERDAAARKVVTACALASAGLTLQPLPGLEQGVVVVQVGMVVALSHVHGEQLSRKRAKEVLMDLGAITGVNILGRQAATTLAKVVLPGIGGVLAAPSAFAITWATGHVAHHYFESGGKPDRNKLRAIFEAEKRRSKQHYDAGDAERARPERDDLDESADG